MTDGEIAEEEAVYAYKKQKAEELLRLQADAYLHELQVKSISERTHSDLCAPVCIHRGTESNLYSTICIFFNRKEAFMLWQIPFLKV